MCDEKFTSEDLSEEGNAFTLAYYQGNGPDAFIAQYENAFRGIEVYAVPPTWESYDRISPVIASSLAKWRRARDRKWWWPF